MTGPGETARVADEHNTLARHPRMAHLMKRLERDSDFRERLVKDPNHAMQKYDLPADEAVALRDYLLRLRDQEGHGII